MNAIHPLFQRLLAPLPPLPRFAVTYCSQCGCSFGPGSAGFSQCLDHRYLIYPAPRK
jgi:hypothetical protein